MPVIASEGQFDRFSSLVKYIDDTAKPNVHNELITATEAANKNYALGTVLGKTAAGVWKISVQNAADGSQVPAAVVIGDSAGVVQPFVVGTTPTKVLVLARGKAIVAREALKLDASFATAPQKQAAEDGLKAVGILVEAAN